MTEPADVPVVDTPPVGDDFVTAAPCSVCGVLIPMRMADYKEMVALGAPIMHREHAASQDEPPVLRSYRAVIQVFEVAEPGAPEELVAAATAKAQAPTLTAAFAGTLSTDLQVKWLALAAKSSLAGLPAGGESPTGD